MLKWNEVQGCKMLKVHFLNSYVGCFPQNLRVFSKDQGKRFRKYVRDIERRYQGRWDNSMVAD